MSLLTGAPGGTDAAHGADDLKEISRKIQARLQAIHSTPSYTAVSGTGTAVGPPARTQQAYKISRVIPQSAVVPRISTGDDRSRVGSLNHSCLSKEINAQTYVFHRSRWPFVLSRSGACRRDGTDCGIMRSARSSSSQGGSRGNDSQRHCGRHRDQRKRAAPVAERGGKGRGDKVRAVGGNTALQRRDSRAFWHNSNAASRSTVTVRQRSRCTGVAWLAQERKRPPDQNTFNCRADLQRQSLLGY